MGILEFNSVYGLDYYLLYDIIEKAYIFTISMNRIWLQRSFIRVCSLPLVEFNVFDVIIFHDNYKKRGLVMNVLFIIDCQPCQ